jgi:signal transduction histidine kinase
MQGLSAGKYKVSAISYNSDLISSEPLTFEFTVANAPFPWFTVLLTLLLLLAVAALVWAIFEHRKITNTSAALANANLELADARLQLANEAESERKRIARDLHDQTLADLRRLMLMSDQLNENGKKVNINPTVFRSEIENVSNEIRRICEDLSPSVLENVGFTAALEFALNDAVAHLPEERRFEYEFICDDDLEDRLNFSSTITMQLYRIAQEAISNVCRHANAKKVRFEILLNDEEFIMKLEDDGHGFDLNTQTSGRGLANIAARASLIEAEIEWLRKEESGMVFVLRKKIAAKKLKKLKRKDNSLLFFLCLFAAMKLSLF